MKALIKETNQRLTFSNLKLEQLQECLELDHLSSDAKSYLRDEIKKTKKNISYYSKLMEQLEKKVSE